MNREWMLQRLAAFRELCQEYRLAALRDDRYTTCTVRALTDQITVQLPTVRLILKRVEPSLADDLSLPPPDSAVYDSLRAVQQAIGIVNDWELVAANLEPDAPSLVADRLHPHVWSAASALWDTGQYRIAVQQAAVSLSAHIAGKAGSSLADRELVSQMFSPSDPKPDQVRLHLPGDKTSRHWRSRQDGLHLLAQGAFAGIRNPATHSGDEWTEQTALEHLAVLSVVARWADETELVAAS